MESPPGTNFKSPAPDLHAAWARLPAGYGIPEQTPTLAEARAYCERLARSHYENFSVATWFLPKRLRPHFYSVYAYCRISDDLGDEVGDPQLSLALLDIWQHELDALYAYLDDASQPVPRHPVFVALAPTIRECGIPHHEFSDLLIAFRQDQKLTRYQTFEDLLGYCRNSANPVGHLVLYLCGYTDAERRQLSDFTCTALQLANFWQDIAVDFDKGRIYLPLDDLRRLNVREQDIAERRFTPGFRELMQFEVNRARKWFELGLPLAASVDKELALDIELFSRGGQAILHAIEKQGYDVLRRRPVVSKGRKFGLLMRALFGKVV
jgi:squalene synthase HpnC